MKRAILLKKLVDIIYVLTVLVITSLVFITASGKALTVLSHRDLSLENLNFYHWSVILICLVVCLVFLRALYYLRKVAKSLLSNNCFTNSTIESLKKSGNNFLYSGYILLVLLVYTLFGMFVQGNIKIEMSSIIASLFLLIIGVFFRLQSSVLILAKDFKEENDLTI